MSSQRTGLLDTSAVVLLSRIADPSLLPERAMIATITLAELAVGPLVAEDPSDRAVRQTHLLLAESRFQPLPFDAEAARAFGPIAAALRRRGRKSAARTFDALIAAIAVANRLPLYTCNPEAFAGIDGLEVVAIPHPDRSTRVEEESHGDRT